MVKPRKTTRDKLKQSLKIAGSKNGLRRLTKKSNPQDLEIFKELNEVVGTIAYLDTEEGKAVSRIAFDKYFFKENLEGKYLYAMDALIVAHDHQMETPKWAFSALIDYMKSVISVNSEKGAVGELLVALEINDARAFSRFRKHYELFEAYFEFKMMIEDGVGAMDARKTISKKYKRLGSEDSLRKKMDDFDIIFLSERPLEDPFSD